MLTLRARRAANGWHDLALSAGRAGPSAIAGDHLHMSSDLALDVAIASRYGLDAVDRVQPLLAARYAELAESVWDVTSTLTSARCVRPEARKHMSISIGGIEATGYTAKELEPVLKMLGDATAE